MRAKKGIPFAWTTCSPSPCERISGKACNSSLTVSLAASPTLARAGAIPLLPHRQWSALATLGLETDHLRGTFQLSSWSVVGCPGAEIEHVSSILADDMGLGKTLQGIALMWTLLKSGHEVLGGNPVCTRAMIVCPTSLVNNWDSECKRWLQVCSPSLLPHMYLLCSDTLPATQCSTSAHLQEPGAFRAAARRCHSVRVHATTSSTVSSCSLVSQGPTTSSLSRMKHSGFMRASSRTVHQWTCSSVMKHIASRMTRPRRIRPWTASRAAGECYCPAHPCRTTSTRCDLHPCSSLPSPPNQSALYFSVQTSEPDEHRHCLLVHTMPMLLPLAFSDCARVSAHPQSWRGDLAGQRPVLCWRRTPNLRTPYSLQDAGLAVLWTISLLVNVDSLCNASKVSCNVGRHCCANAVLCHGKFLQSGRPRLTCFIPQTLRESHPGKPGAWGQPGGAEEGGGAL
jgi:hypothetical protein